MKVSKLRALWIILMSVANMLNICGQSVFMRLFNRINRPWVDEKLRTWTRRVLHLVRVSPIVINPYDTKPQPGHPTIIMCNHSSLYDIPLSMFAFPNDSMRMLAKKELSRIPIVGKGMSAAEFPFVDRKNRHQAIKDLQVIKKLLESGIVMWIAPEGTRSKDGKLNAFKKGGFITAINAKATIIPIGIRGADKILPARTLQFNLGEPAEIHIGEAIDTSAYTLESKDALIERVHQVMRGLVGE